jgi:hypothetical protein
MKRIIYQILIMALFASAFLGLLLAAALAG